jgi:glyoxylase-like metal-dependent hydrolase (beta-lactamase superfamily II)
VYNGKKKMFSSQLDSKHFLIDLKPAGFPQFIASYVLKAEKTAIVESGPTSTVPNLLTGLKEVGVNFKDVDYVFASHIHLDHGGGLGSLLKTLPKAKAIVHKRGVQHIVNPEKLWDQANHVLGGVARLYGEPIPVPKERVITAEDGMTFNLGNGVELEVIETLGHASHHQCFYERSYDSVFPGDTAGIYIPKFDVIVPTTPPPLRLDMLLASIEKLKLLKPSLLYYSHFGRATDALEKLQTYIDQLKLWESVVEEVGEGSTDLEIKDVLERRDPAVWKIREYVEIHPTLKRDFILQNIQAFREYLEYRKRK